MLIRSLGRLELNYRYRKYWQSENMCDCARGFFERACITKRSEILFTNNNHVEFFKSLEHHFLRTKYCCVLLSKDVETCAVHYGFSNYSHKSTNTLPCLRPNTSPNHASNYSSLQD
jgi:hypothetical protein